MRNDRWKWLAALVAFAMLMPAVALAGKKAPAKPGKSKKMAKKMAWPKPADQMSQLKFFLGRWRCKGKFHGMPGVPAHDYRSAMTVKKTLDGHWVQMTWAQKKSRTVKHPYKGMAVVGYDAANARFRSSMVDNMNGLGWARSSGWQGDKWVDEGKGRMGKHLFDTRATITKTGKRAFKIVNEMKSPKGWQTLAEESCKR